MAIKGIALQSPSMDGGIPTVTLISLIPFMIHITALITRVDVIAHTVSGIWLVNDLWCVATQKDVNQVVKKQKDFTVESFKCANR